MEDDITQDTRAPRERSNANLRPFSHDHQPVKRGGAVDGARMYRWAADLPVPESLVADITKIFPEARKKLTLDEARHVRLFLQAVAGDVQANREIDNRLYGRALQRVEIEKNDEPESDTLRDLPLEILYQIEELIKIGKAQNACGNIESKPET